VRHAEAPGVTKGEIAAELEVSVRTVSRWMRAGLPHGHLRNGRPTFELGECIAWARQPAECRRLESASCEACGYAIELVVLVVDGGLPICPCGAGTLHGAERAS
jgi:orotate phosphoribosyltransferase-like protein